MDLNIPFDNIEYLALLIHLDFFTPYYFHFKKVNITYCNPFTLPSPHPHFHYKIQKKLQISLIFQSQSFPDFRSIVLFIVLIQQKFSTITKFVDNILVFSSQTNKLLFLLKNISFYHFFISIIKYVCFHFSSIGFFLE